MTEEEQIKLNEALEEYDKQVEAARSAGIPLDDEQVKSFRQKREEEVRNSIRNSMANNGVPSAEQVPSINNAQEEKKYDAPKVNIRNKNAVSRGSKKAKMIPAMLAKISEKWRQLEISINNDLSAHLNKVNEKYDTKISKAEDKLAAYEAKIQEKIANKVENEDYAKKQLTENTDENISERLKANADKAEYARTIKEVNVRNRFANGISREENKIDKLHKQKTKALGRKRPLRVTAMVFEKLFKNGFDRRLRMTKDAYESDLVDYIEKLPVVLEEEQKSAAQAELEQFINNIEGARNKKEAENRYDEAIAYFNGKYLNSSSKVDVESSQPSDEKQEQNVDLPVDELGKVTNEEDEINADEEEYVGDDMTNEKIPRPAESIKKQIDDLLANYKNKENPKKQVRDLVIAEGLCRTIGDKETADKIIAEINRIAIENHGFLDQSSPWYDEFSEKALQKSGNIDTNSQSEVPEPSVNLENDVEEIEEKQEVMADDTPIDELKVEEDIQPVASSKFNFGSVPENDRKTMADDAQLFDMLLSLKDYKEDIARRQERLTSLEKVLRENEERLNYTSDYINTTQKNIDRLRNDVLLASDGDLSHKTQIISNLERDNLARRTQVAELERQADSQRQNLSAGKETLNLIIIDKEELEKKIADFQAGAKVSQAEIDDFKKRTDDYADQTRLLAQEQAKMQYRRENTEDIDKEIANRRTYEALRNNLYSSANIDDDSEYPPRNR